MIELAETKPESDVPAGTDAQIGRYAIKRVVGSGAMGVVLAAHDPELDRSVAIKLISVADDGPVREAQAMAKLSHPNVVQVYEVLHLETRKAIVMELVDGEDLATWQQREERSWRAIVDVYLQASRGLAAAHAAGIVHRDFKPSNVLVDRDGKAHVTDFGLARSVATTSGLPRVDGTGIAGTPVYMAPEQHACRGIDARTDQWGFACSLYEALYGHRPFSTSEGPALAEAVAKGVIEDEPAGTHVPRRIRAAIRRALSVDPAARFPSMDELAAVLAPPSRRITLGLVAVLVVAAIAASALLLRKDNGPTCDGLDAPMHAVWSDAARSALQTRLSAADVALPPTAIDNVLRGIDAYAAAWTTTRVQACTDGKRGVRSAQVLDTRMQCLDRNIAEVSTLLDGLASGPTITLHSASDAVTQLRPAALCLTSETTARAATPALQAQLDAADTDLSRATTLISLSQFEKALVVVDRVIAIADPTFPSLLARALVVRGLVVHRLGSETDALATHQRAAKVAASAREPAVLADALTNAFFIDVNGLGHRADGLKSRPFIDLAVESAGNPDDVRASWEHFQAIALYDDPTHTDEAAVLEQHSLAIRQRILPAGHPFIYDSMQTLGNIEVRRKNYDEGLKLFQQILAHKIATRGPNDTEVSEENNNIGTVAYYRDDVLGALDYFQRAVAISRADGPLNVNAINNLGLTQLDLGRWTSATATFETYRRETEQRTSGDAETLAEAEVELGTNAMLAGDLVRAKSLLDHGLERSRASQSVTLGTALAYSARLAIQLGDLSRARALLDETAKVSTNQGELRTFVAAELALAETSCKAARPALTAAYETAVKAPNHFVTSQAVIVLARCELELGDRAAAKAHLETELAWFTTSGAEDIALAPVRALLSRAN